MFGTNNLKLSNHVIIEAYQIDWDLIIFEKILTAPLKVYIIMRLGTCTINLKNHFKTIKYRK